MHRERTPSQTGTVECRQFSGGGLLVDRGWSTVLPSTSVSTTDGSRSDSAVPPLVRDDSLSDGSYAVGPSTSVDFVPNRHVNLCGPTYTEDLRWVDQVRRPAIVATVVRFTFRRIIRSARWSFSRPKL